MILPAFNINFKLALKFILKHNIYTNIYSPFECFKFKLLVLYVKMYITI